MRSKIPFTHEGYEAVKKEYHKLQEQRTRTVQELSEARDMGDRSENAAYKSARWKLSGIDRRLKHLSNILKYGEVVSSTVPGVINIGSTVIVHDGTDEKTFSIVGGYELDTLQGKISNASPIGKALIGKKVGDSITITIPAGKLQYKIVKITP